MSWYAPLLFDAEIEDEEEVDAPVVVVGDAVLVVIFVRFAVRFAVVFAPFVFFLALSIVVMTRCKQRAHLLPTPF